MGLEHYKSFEELTKEIRGINYHGLHFIGTHHRKQLAKIIYDSIEGTIEKRLKHNLPCSELIMNLHDLDTLQLHFTEVIQCCTSPYYTRQIKFNSKTLIAYISRYNEIELGMFLIR